MRSVRAVNNFRTLPTETPKQIVEALPKGKPDLKSFGAGIEPLHPIQIERFRVMTFREKMAVSQGLFRMARRARLESVRKSHPELDEKQWHDLVAKEFARSRT